MGDAVNKPGNECTNNTACYTRQALLYMITITTAASGYPFHQQGVTAHLARNPGGPLAPRARQQNQATPRHEGGTGRQSNRPGRSLLIGHFSNVDRCSCHANSISHRSPILQQHRAPGRQLNPLSYQYQTWMALAASFGASGWRATAPSSVPATRGATRSGPTNHAHRDPTYSEKGRASSAVWKTRPIEFCQSISRAVTEEGANRPKSKGAFSHAAWVRRRI